MIAHIRKFTYPGAAKTQIKNIRHKAKVNIKSEKPTPFEGIYYASLFLITDNLKRRKRKTLHVNW